MEGQAQNRADRIQNRIDDNVADVPSFHGNYKDTITLKAYLSRIDQGITTLGWTQQTAFTYFSNSVKSVAAAWLECYLTDNPDTPRTWQEVKPDFRKAFGDVTDPVVFAQELCNIKPEHHGNCLFTYYAAITRAVNLHQEEFLTPPAQPPLPQGHNLDEDQQTLVGNIYRQAHTAAVRSIHTKLRQEFFLNGLPKKQLDLIGNKPHLTTVNQMIAFIHQQETIDKKKTGSSGGVTNGSGSHTPSPSVSVVHSTIEPEIVQEEISAAFQPPNRGQNGRGTANRGWSNGGYRGNANRGTANRGGNRGGNNFSTGSNPRSNTSNTSSNTSGKTCIYCRKTGHIQDHCYSRINRNDPCIDNQGKSYFPKINSANTQDISSNSVFFLEN